MPLKHVNVNVCKCRRACGLTAADVPICVGAACPLLGGAEVEASFFHGFDGLGDVDDPGAVPVLTDEELSGTQALSDEPAVDALLRLSVEAATTGHTLHVVTLGPLTNLALALRQDPMLSRRLGSVVVMGGCGNARGNASPTSEFNIRADPESAEEVFKALAPPKNGQQIVSVVPWELTADFPLPWSWFDAVLSPRVNDNANTRDHSTGHVVRRFLAAVLRNSYGTGHTGATNQRKTSGAVICDALAVAVCLDRGTVVTAEKSLHCTVECAGVYTRGQTVCDWDDQVAGFSHEAPNVRWITGVDVTRYQQLLDTALGMPSKL